MCGNYEMELFVKERNWVCKDSEVRDYIIMYERILPKIMKQYAPQVFYWPASPSSGGSFDDPRDENRGDVHYWAVWHGDKPFSEYRKFYFRYLSEFGFQSFPSKKTVETFTDDERDMNIFSYIMERHQRNGSANGKIMNYMQQTYRYPSDFETVIYASQLLQADAIRYGVEHFRRNRNDDRCMGAVYWQFNDCWPVTSWSSVDYCQRLKALHYYARRFFAPIMISCEEEGMLGSGQELVRLPFEFPKSIRLCVAPAPPPPPPPPAPRPPPPAPAPRGPRSLRRHNRHAPPEGGGARGSVDAHGGAADKRGRRRAFSSHADARRPADHPPRKGYV